MPECPILFQVNQDGGAIDPLIITDIKPNSGGLDLDIGAIMLPSEEGTYEIEIIARINY